jgi:hypothetical protein
MQLSEPGKNASANSPNELDEQPNRTHSPSRMRFSPRSRNNGETGVSGRRESRHKKLPKNWLVNSAIRNALARSIDGRFRSRLRRYLINLSVVGVWCGTKQIPQ